MPLNTTQDVLIGVVGGLLVLPLLGFLGAVFLNWSRLLMDLEPLQYWSAYKVSTLGSMASLVFLVPTQFVTHRLGSVGFVIDVALSTIVLGLFYSRWIRNHEGHGIGLEEGFWLSTMQTALWLVVAGVFFGLSIAMQPEKTFWGVVLAITCAGLLVAAASISLRRTVSSVSPPAPNLSWKTEDLSELYRHAAEEFDRDRDEELWALATIARQSPEQQREWYLAERVKKLKEIAENQLRREGIL